MARAYTARSRERGRSRDTLDRLDTILELAEEHHPFSIRQMFYLMTNPRLRGCVTKDDSGYGKIQRALLELRREDRIPYSWVVDSIRSSSNYDWGHNSPREFVTDSLDKYGYHKDYWKDNQYSIQVWCEARSLAPVLEDIVRACRVSLYPAGGFTSDTFLMSGMDRFRKKKEQGKTPVIIYVGDYDPAGVTIDKDIKVKMLHLLENGGTWDGYDDYKNEYEYQMSRGREPGSSDGFHFWRIAINEDQITEYDLPTKPRKKGERRMPGIGETVEAEAMPPRIMQRLLFDWIRRYMPQEEFDAIQATERRERDMLGKLFEMFGDDIEEHFNVQDELHEEDSVT